MSAYQPLSEVSTAGFDKAMKEFTKEVAEHGWLGRRTKQGHIIARAPDGETTMCITRSELRGRSDKNVRAQFNRWLRQHEPEEQNVEVPTPAEVFKPEPEQVPPPEDPHDEQGNRLTPIYDDADDEMGEIVEQYAEEEAKRWECVEEGCDRTFATERGLKSHRRKHTLVYDNCPLCDQRVTYMGKHLRMTHKATAPHAEGAILGKGRSKSWTDPVDALEEVIDEVTRLRAEVEELRSERDEAVTRLELLREALNA